MPPVFPGAQGYGTLTRAAYGGGVAPVVLAVSNLNNSGAGSLRAALIDPRPRVVVFLVSGYINLASRIDIFNPYLTVAGATAPSPGISIRNYAIQVRTHDVLIQHLRNRVGAVDPNGADGFSIYGTDSYNVVLDHLSVSWAVDGSIDVASGSTTAERNITVSNCIMAEHLRNNGISGVKQNHSRAMAIQNRAKKITVLRNLFAHVGQRLPFMKSDTRTVVVNNLIYDQFQQIGMYLDDPDSVNLPSYASVVGNRYVEGPSAAALGVSTLQGLTVRAGMDSGSKVYQSDNTSEGTKYNHANFVRSEVTWGTPFVGSPPAEAPTTGLTILASTAVEAHVLANVGARPADRDDVDDRIIGQVTNRTGQYVDSPSDVGGYPSLAQNSHTLTVPSDPHAVQGSGYTNLEEWLHTFNAAVESGGSLPDPDPGGGDPEDPEEGPRNPLRLYNDECAQVRFVVGLVDVTLPSYLWGFSPGRHYLERLYGTSYAHLFREKLGTALDALVATFETDSATIDLLRDVTIEAMRTGLPVTFYPNASDTGVSVEVDWEPTGSIARVVDNRDRYTVVLRMRTPGEPETGETLSALLDETSMTEAEGLQDETEGLTPLESET